VVRHANRGQSNAPAPAIAVLNAGRSERVER
jgi:hypothetical protein